MTHNPNPAVLFPTRAHAELELLQMLLQEEADSLDTSVAYPWNPAEAESYFEVLEQAVLQAGWTEAEFTEPGQAISNLLNQAWAEATLPVSSVSTAMLSLLQQFASRFDAQVPQQVLSSIAQQAQQLMSENRSIADRMVDCVRDCFPAWAEEDLQVLARPFAFAMRSAETEVLEAALRSMRCAAWSDLSGVEQARLSLAIARYAIDHAASDPHEV